MKMRQKLEAMFTHSPIQGEELMFNLGLYTRSSLLVKFLVMHELYRRIKDIPGALMEFGVWWGQNLVLLENLRAIHEPFNKQRQIVGFDTFTGYTNFSGKDKKSGALSDGTYATPKDYKAYLEDLLELHESLNILGHATGNHTLVKGDLEKTAPKYFKDNPETIVALAYFDIGLYKPTKAALLAIKPHLVPGSVILFDELTWKGAPGEAIAFKELFKDTRYSIEKCEYYPSKSIVTIKS
ncbi:MAG: dTDP-6-deoxy-L-hexose 3-O-methyltransferase [Proteobacteria bacterium]|nr:dTDP-6-deoxy-L-hexose 3-O-methyltransferase [Pseudomonadota bacterium]